MRADVRAEPTAASLALIAGGVSARAEAQEAAEDDESAGAADLGRRRRRPDDAVVALSASGRTPYVLGAVRAAARAGALTSDRLRGGTELGRLADHAVVTVVGPEVIAGSTRMKAGTAQKLVLNTISTVSMIRLGRTYGNLMVDVVASNAKLRARARRAVELATGVLRRGDRRRARRRGRRREGRDRLAPHRPRRARARGSGSKRRAAPSAPRWKARLRLGVEAAVVDGLLLRGDVEIADGRIAAVGLNGSPGRGIAIPGLVDLQVNGFGGVDFAVRRPRRATAAPARRCSSAA